jgi:hypothetical protein
MLETWVNDAKLWLKQPYRQNGDVLDWFLFLGLVIVVTMAWGAIIKRIVD